MLTYVMFSFSFCCYHLFPGDKDSRNNMTSCCSTESERPHRCCQLPNNFGLRTILYNGLGDAPKNCPFPWGSRTPPINMVPWVYPNCISSGLAVLAQLMVVSDQLTHTQRHATHVAIGRIYLLRAHDAARWYQIVRELWREAASPPQTDSSVVFARWRQYVPP